MTQAEVDAYRAVGCLIPQDLSIGELMVDISDIMKSNYRRIERGMLRLIEKELNESSFELFEHIESLKFAPPTLGIEPHDPEMPHSALPCDDGRSEVFTRLVVLWSGFDIHVECTTEHRECFALRSVMRDPISTHIIDDDTLRLMYTAIRNKLKCLCERYGLKLLNDDYYTILIEDMFGYRVHIDLALRSCVDRHLFFDLRLDKARQQCRIGRQKVSYETNKMACHFLPFYCSLMAFLHIRMSLRDNMGLIRRCFDEIGNQFGCVRQWAKFWDNMCRTSPLRPALLRCAMEQINITECEMRNTMRGLLEYVASNGVATSLVDRPPADPFEEENSACLVCCNDVVEAVFTCGCQFACRACAEGLLKDEKRCRVCDAQGFIIPRIRKMGL